MDTEESGSMRMSRLFGETLRQASAGTGTPGYELLSRAGYIRSLAPGLFSYLPLGLRSLRKIEAILRGDLERLGAQEIRMPLVQPATLWSSSGKRERTSAEAVGFRDRAGRSWVIGPSHEQVAVDLVRANVTSYRQLPVVLYQIDTTYRDEVRPRAGLMRAREFTLLASYSFDRNEERSAATHRQHREAFWRSFERVGLREVMTVRGEAGADETACEELILVLPMGDDHVAHCRACGYAAKGSVARFAKPEPAGEAPRPLEKVATPRTESIAALADYLDVSTERTAKVVFFEAGEPESAEGSGSRDAVVMALVRGDMEVSEAKLRAASGTRFLRPADAAAIRAIGAEPGYASPVGLSAERLVVVVDDLVARSTNLISGANEAGYHYRNVNIGRDYRPDEVADIARVVPGAACAECGSPLYVQPCIEVGSLHRFRAEYSSQQGATFQDEDGTTRPLAMGSYGVGLGRLLGCIAETHRDEYGLRLPTSIAPFQLHLVAITGGDAELTARADDVYSRLRDSGIDVLYDDRDASPGIKFNDADLIGIPLRLTLGSRSIRAGGLELKRRGVPGRQIVRFEEALEVLGRPPVP